jgi:hypothetical protein
MIEAGNQQVRTLILRQGGGGVQKDHRVHATGYRHDNAIEPGARVTDRVYDSVSLMPALHHGILI